MAFDGFMVAALCRELSGALTGGRIQKIAQPEKDALVLTVKNDRAVHRVLLSCSPSLPLLYLAETVPAAPMTAPAFCMLLRKHIGSGRILSVSQVSLERVVDITVEHLDEMGDLGRKHLILEIMGKHSNLIFCGEDYTILDAMRRVPASVSSVREVLPGRPWFLPDEIRKADPLSADEAVFRESLGRPEPAVRALTSVWAGFSYPASQEVCWEAGVDPARLGTVLSPEEKDALWQAFSEAAGRVRSGAFSLQMILKGDAPSDLTALPAKAALSAPSFSSRPYTSPSRLLEDYYAGRDRDARIRQRSADLRLTVENLLERTVKKYDLQTHQLQDTEKREKYRVYGELLTAYAYQVAPGEKSVILSDWNTGKEVTVPLDPELSPMENANRFFARYQKQKRTYEALSEQIVQTRGDLEHLQSIRASLSTSMTEEDLLQVRQELEESGFIKKHAQDKKKRPGKARPLHYLSSDGFHIYVGKNNLQNEEVSFGIAGPGDWWFHVKGVPGSHVIVRTEGKELPDRVYEEAAALAAYYSSEKDAEKVEVDYLPRRELKKVPGARPGFVIYHTNYSMVVSPSLSGLKEICQ